MTTVRIERGRQEQRPSGPDEEFEETTCLSRQFYCAVSFLVWSILTWPYYIHGEPAIWEYAPKSLYLLDASVTLVAASSVMTMLFIFCKCFDTRACMTMKKAKASLLMIAAIIHVVATALLIRGYCGESDVNNIWQCSCIISAFNFGYVACILFYFSFMVLGHKYFANGDQIHREFRIVYLSVVVLISNALILAKEFDMHSGSSKKYNGLKAGLGIVCIASVMAMIGVAQKCLNRNNKLVYYSIAIFFVAGGIVSFAYSFPTLADNGNNFYVKLSAIGFGWLQFAVDSLIAVEIYAYVQNQPSEYMPLQSV